MRAKLQAASSARSGRTYRGRVSRSRHPGDYLGEASLLTGVARNAAVEAVTAATVYEIDKADFEPFLIARPEMIEMLAHTLASRNSHRDSNAIAVPAATALTAIANQIRTFFRNDRGPRS